MNIGEVLIENIPQLWMGMVGILLNSIVVGTLFGKRKYDWFFPVICSVRFIIYNIGFLAIGNAMKHGIRLQCLRLQQSLHWG